jgi:hypothetical protein
VHANVTFTRIIATSISTHTLRIWNKKHKKQTAWPLQTVQEKTATFFPVTI